MARLRIYHEINSNKVIQIFISGFMSLNILYYVYNIKYLTGKRSVKMNKNNNNYWLK